MTPRHTAIVDFPDRATGGARRLAFGRPDRVLQADAIGDVREVLAHADREARSGAWVVGFVSYEAAPAFDSAFTAAAGSRLPLAWFAVFTRGPDDAPPGPPTRWPEAALEPRAEVSGARYAASVARIREYIAAGDVYQVNYTVPFDVACPDDPVVLYERLRRAQQGAYSACFLTERFAVMSASPELFFERRGSLVRMRPMKGTAPRGLSAESDAAACAALKASEKDRAENVMIVDLVRSDLGRVARTGSVRVASLFEAERYPGVWQLTSTVEADVAPERPLLELFDALFPCGSVTGAPKVRATRIIAELEPAPREVYCGAVGVLYPGGDAVFNVAIRTAWTTGGSGVARLGAGGAVTADSTVGGELGEVALKLAAFTRPPLVPTLFETMRVEHGRPLRLQRHLDRLAASARYFDIPFDAGSACAALAGASQSPGTETLARGRLVLHPSGDCSAELTPFSGEQPGSRPVGIAPSAVSRHDVRLYHKTSDRSLYDAALAARPGAFDVILWNEEGDATELTRGNLVARFGDALVTPPVACGLLPGTLRGELLNQGRITERVLPLATLGNADELWFVNALRGWVPIRL